MESALTKNSEFSQQESDLCSFRTPVGRDALPPSYRRLAEAGNEIHSKYSVKSHYNRWERKSVLNKKDWMQNWSRRQIGPHFRLRISISCFLILTSITMNTQQRLYRGLWQYSWRIRSVLMCYHCMCDAKNKPFANDRKAILSKILRSFCFTVFQWLRNSDPNNISLGVEVWQSKCTAAQYYNRWHRHGLCGSCWIIHASLTKWNNLFLMAAVNGGTVIVHHSFVFSVKNFRVVRLGCQVKKPLYWRMKVWSDLFYKVGIVV